MTLWWFQQARSVVIPLVLLHCSDALWKPLVAKVFDGAYIEELEKYNCLSAFTGKTFRDAFMYVRTSAHSFARGSFCCELESRCKL